jgi:hypothetical protein
MKLNENNLAILRVLAEDREWSPTAADVSEACGHRLRTWAGPKLAALYGMGLVKPSGIAIWASNAKTWEITPAGRASLYPEGRWER